MLWNLRRLRQMDLKVIPILLGLAALSLLVTSFRSPKVLMQLRWFGVGWGLLLLLRWL